MVLKGWLLLFLYPAVVTVLAQDPPDICKSALGLSSGTEEDVSITSPLGDDTTPSAGRLNNEEGAWCFFNESISSSAALIIDLGYKRFVSGFGSQGPPESIQPKTYHHLIAFSTAFSLDKMIWEEFNEGNLFFDVDKNDTADAVSYHTSSTVELTQYVKINVTMHVSGSTTICLRFELYGCDTDIQPYTNVQATTTPKGKIEVMWQKPSVETSLEPDTTTTGILRPPGYLVLYRPLESETGASAPTGDRMVSLEDVRLGATYEIQLQCIYKDIIVSCGSTQVEAYPPCPEDFTGGNEYHCFLYLSSVSSFSEARTLCLNPNFDKQLGKLGYLVDEDERKFLVSRILPKDASDFWLIGDMCQENEDCCKILKVTGGDTLEDVECSEESLSFALCLRDHKGEGARLRVSSVEASDDGSAAWFTWRYEGTGWKTDELQVKMWTSDENNPSTFTFTTLSETFEIKVDVSVMYSLLLRPAPNIRTEELVYKFIIIDFQGDSARYGALLTPVSMSIYIIWSGSIRVTWDEAKALSKSGEARTAEKYSIMHQMSAPESGDGTTVEIQSEREFLLTAIAMRATYVFEMACYFSGAFQPCGMISITTDPPDLVLYKPSKAYIIYETILDRPKIWGEAEEDCNQRSGHLTSLLDDAEAKALLKMLPNKDVKMWTGAKLGKKGTGYWTDGEKITDLPMAKNSGVTSSSESCCRAINEMGKLRLAGGNCEETYPYICKYTVAEIMSVPGDLTVAAHTWNSFELSWSRPQQRWLPTFYNVRACLKETKADCVVKNELMNEWQMKVQGLRQFRNYDVVVEAVLQPVDVKTLAAESTMTYPKSPIQVNISPKGRGTISTPMLVAIGSPEATVTATLSQLDVNIATVSGGVKDVVITGLVPEEMYKLVVQQDGGEWTHEESFTAVPTCSGRDELVDLNCYNTLEDPMNFDDAKKHCSQTQYAEGGGKMSLWTPESGDELKTVMEELRTYSNVWVDKPKDGNIPNTGSDADCSTTGEDRCCFYNAAKSNLICSPCCDRKLAFICTYKNEEAYIGEASNLLPSFVGNTSISVEWSAPKNISWSIRRYEVEWIDMEKNGASIGKEVLVGTLEKQIEGLEFGTEYSVKVTPLGATSLRGKTTNILITTLDPRTPIAVSISQDGDVRVYSPLLIEKGRGSENVNVKVFKMDKSRQSKQDKGTVKGVAQKVELKELEVGQLYWLEMTPVATDKKLFNYTMEFFAFPTCEENQIQEKFVCVWAPPETKHSREAAEICKGSNGEILDYKTQGELSQAVKALLASHIHQKFWLDTAGSADLNSNCPSGQEEEVRCCSYEVSDEGELNDLTCACCDEPRPFACKKVSKINLGSIQNVAVEDVKSTSLTVSWTMGSQSNWGKPSFLITWSELSARRKREVENQVVADQSPASVKDLKPGTHYNLAVAPYVKNTESSGDPKEIKVTTAPDLTVASLVEDTGCTMIIFKMSCCVTVILGSAFTVFVFIATRMFYLDCLAQIFAELATLGAYVCILVSSAQSYNNDSICLRANPTLCVAVSVLIQFFFQVVYLFTFLETLQISTTLKDYMPHCLHFKSSLGMSVIGFGIPAVMMIVLAATASDGFSDGNDNCWLDLQGQAVLPSVIPVITFGSVSCLLLLSVFASDGPREDISGQQAMRGRIYMKTRWACFAMLCLMSICYGTGMTSANNRDETLNYVFIVFSITMGILMPLIRIRSDDEVEEQLKRGLFTSLRDDMGAIRVSPAPAKYDPKPLLNMSEIETRQYKQQQLEELKNKELMQTETVWHQ